jgi:hypothetical protein
MPTLSDGELFKKTLRTTLVMLGSTAVWLGALTGAVLVSTGPSAAGGAEAKADKPSTATAPLPATPGQAGRPPGGGPNPRSIHPSRANLKAELPRPGDSI